MKAICLLLCLALAQGHIFRRQSRYPNMDRVIVQPLEDILSYKEQQPEVYRTQMADSGVMIKSWRNSFKPSSEDSEHQHMKDEDRQQNTNMPGIYRPNQAEAHRDTNAEDNYWPRKIYVNSMPVYGDDVQTQETRNNQRQPEMQMAQPVYGDAASWNGVEIAAAPSSMDVTKNQIERIFARAYNSMTHLNKGLKQNLHQIYARVAETPNEDSYLNATELLQKHQYPVETHTIKTDDGYLLTLFRIQPKDQAPVQRPIVFLMHGLLGSADDWLLMGPGKSLAYLLADAGYEVWLGNARGSKYSRRHVSKHPAQADFWQYSNDEIALHDLPAMIDYTLKTSQQEKLYYVGYSQGTTTFFALMAARPEYNNKIIMMYALSPMVYMSEVRSPLFRMIAPSSPFYERLHMQLGHGEFKPSQELVHTLGGSMCENEIGCKNICSNVNFVMAGVSPDNLEAERMPVIMSHLPAGGSTRQMKQYAQAVASREFTRYNYGPAINQEVYGSHQAPIYDLAKVTTPVALYYSEEDWLASPTDVNRLANALPNVKESYKVQDPHFSHMDFQFSKNVNEVVYNKLINSIKENTQNYEY